MPRHSSPRPGGCLTEIDTTVLVLGATSLVGGFLPGVAGPRRLLGVSRAPPGGGGFDWTRADLAGGSVDFPSACTALALCPIWLVPAVLPALERAGVERLVAMSSTSRWTKARSPDPAERAVAERLAKGEAAVEAFATARAWRWTVLRPTLIYAEGRDRNVSRIARLVRRFGVAPIAGDGRGLRQPVHARDLAAGALAALDAAATYGRAYDLPGGETLSYAAMVARVFEGLGRRPRLIHVPPPLWRVGLALAQPLLPGANAAMGARMAEDLTFDPGPAATDFGWSPRAFRPVFDSTAHDLNR